LDPLDLRARQGHWELRDTKGLLVCWDPPDPQVFRELLVKSGLQVWVKPAPRGYRVPKEMWEELVLQVLLDYKASRGLRGYRDLQEQPDLKESRELLGLRDYLVMLRVLPVLLALRVLLG
jgi:hypothetical protein